MNNTISINKLLVFSTLICSVLSVNMAYYEVSHLYLVLFFVFVFVGLAMEFEYLLSPPRIIINFCALAVLVVILSQLRRNNIIEPFMKVILAMTAVKIIEKKSARDYMQLLLLNLMMLICYAMVSMDKSFVLYCFGEGILCSFIMILSAWQTKDPQGVISFKNLKQLLYRVLLIFLLTIPTCLFIFVIAPRVRSPFFGVVGSQGSAQIGFSDHVSLGGVSEIQKNNKLAFRAEMKKQLLIPYWRGVVMDSFDGRTWISSTNPPNSSNVYSNTSLVKQEIYLEPGRRRYLFALDIPVMVNNVNAEISANGIIVYRGRNDGRRLQYSAVSSPANSLTISGSNFRRRRNLELPQGFIPRLWGEVARITEGLNQSEKISAILYYLSPPNFEYSLTDLSDDNDALEHFIFENKKGSCEFFASAMGVMLRMADIPSRLVGGYKGGMYNEAGGYYAVFEESAHVWVELWDQERSSWLRYDPTPPSNLVDWDMDDYGFFEAYLDLLDYHWTKFVLNYNLELQVEIMQAIKDIVRNPNISSFDEFFKTLPIVFGVVVLIIIGAFIIWKVISEDKSKALVHSFVRIMKRKGFTKHKSEGLHEFSDRLPRHEQIKIMPFIECFEEYYYKEKEFDEVTVKLLKEKLRILKM
ncbi:MAG: DUF3488 and transglutaminase-like domain-containing protein [Synergistaceae bacterium]|nr:DUF3488 and transglutaminase-like domain-containing protein [Synergistaceae bacterium]